MNNQLNIFGDIDSSEELKVGDTAFAVGAPLDSSTYAWTVTRGVISGKNRKVVIMGKELHSIVSLCVKNGYLDIEDDILGNLTDLKLDGTEFIEKLIKENQRDIYVRISALNNDNYPIEQI